MDASMTLSQHYQRSVYSVRNHGFDRPIHYEEDAISRADAVFAKSREVVADSWPVTVGVLPNGRIGALVTTGSEPIAIVFEELQYGANNSV